MGSLRAPDARRCIGKCKGSGEEEKGKFTHEKRREGFLEKSLAPGGRISMGVTPLKGHGRIDRSTFQEEGKTGQGEPKKGRSLLGRLFVPGRPPALLLGAASKLAYSRKVPRDLSQPTS
ncbi:hypothetical protein MPNT_20034 [Candidatus Methylacidithermus pantelleriae]|uniref:Uncharacterized protein n=1 Tax=Candidatus Methylacidithermus pantelleriae TaxID=2744239 RepID=A0A8J2FS19_9BACT|nr:hypothetical protein MPNT_20034 [Candidatus Methylacidithermus pantelleriae]